MLLGQLVDALHRVTRGELVLDPDLVLALVTRQRARDPLQELTEREQAVLTLMAEGRSNAGIAARLYLSPKTVERNVATVFDKLGLPGQRRQPPGPGRHRLPAGPARAVGRTRDRSEIYDLTDRRDAVRA